jgi:3-methyl-2-oxobutanoate hydroxymethyltransferase
VNSAARAYFDEVRTGAFPDEEHSFRSTSMRLVASNPDVETTERDEKHSVFGVPV